MTRACRDPPEIHPIPLYDYTKLAGGTPDEDMKYHGDVTVATSQRDVDRVDDYIVQVISRVLHSLDMGCPISFDGPVSVRDHLDDTAIWLVRESFAFEVHFPEFANTTRLLSKRLRDISALETGGEIYEHITELYDELSA